MSLNRVGSWLDIRSTGICIPIWFAIFLSAFTVHGEEPDQKNDLESQNRIQQLIDEAKYHEIYGRMERRDELLRLAEQVAGKEHASVQSMRGKINDGVAWRTPAEITERTLANETHKKYVSLREKVADNLPGQLQLADWCLKNRLPKQGKAHLNRALWHDPSNARIRTLLGHRQVEGRWVTPEQMAAETTRLLVTRKRVNAWQKEVNEIRELIQSPNRGDQNKGLQRIRDIDDATAVPALELILAHHSHPVSKEVIKKFASFEEQEASMALMRMSLNSPWFSCRQLAIDELSKRDKYHYVPTLLSQLVSPISSRVMVVPGARRQVLYRHVYFQKTMDSDVVKQYDTVYQRISSGRTNGTDSLRQTLRDIRRNVPSNERLKEQQNQSIQANNQRIINVMTEALGLKLGDDVEAWWKWWNDHNEVYTEVRPVDYDRYQRAVEVYDRDMFISGGGTPSRIPARTGGSSECLVAGTTIWTDRGPLAVEKITTGDRVLSQNIETGQLEYQTVIRPTVRPKTATVTIKLAGETIRCSGGHPFWVAGEGWVKARDLKPGLPLSCSQGIAMIRDVNPAPASELYNLVVDGNSNYFIGESKVLSHDNTIPTPTMRRVPGMSK